MKVTARSGWTFVLLSGCGGVLGSSAGSCNDSTTCGGDIVGKWTITSSCLTVDLSMVGVDCAASTGDASGLKLTGHITYSADLTYTSSTTISGSASVTLPDSCLTSQGVTVTCTELAQATESNPDYKSVNCTAVGSECTCVYALEDRTSTEIGAYTTTPAGVLTETPTGGTPEDSAYCVKGKSLTESAWHDATVDRRSRGQGTISGTTAFAKP